MDTQTKSGRARAGSSSELETISATPGRVGGEPSASRGEPAPTLPEGLDYSRFADAELIERCLDADRSAWAAIVDRYGGLIYSIAWRSNLPDEDVADVFQSVSLALLEELERLRDRTKLSSWLTTVTIHQCMRVKRQRSRSLLSLEEMKNEVAGIRDGSILPDEEVQKLEKQHLVRRALSMMDQPCRQLLTQLFFGDGGSSYKEIARQLGVSVSTIGPKRGRCLKRLLHILTEIGL